MTMFTVTTIDPQPAAVVRAEVPMDELRAVFDRGFHQVMQVVQAQGVAIAGPPFGFYPRMPTDTVEVAVGFPVSAPVTDDGDVTSFELPGGRVVTGVHVGPYDGLATTYGELTEWAAAEGHALADHMWESYLTDPAAEPDPAGWQTRITWPLAAPE
jgi:effector-binding domain-containing protein